MTTVPRLRLTTAALDELASNRRVFAALVGQIVTLLRRYPHFMVLNGPPPTEDRRLTLALLRAIAQTPPQKPGLPDGRRDKVSFTRVRIDAQADGKGSDDVTRYSRTNQPLALHTDSSYMGEPHELIAFQMVRADAAGGETLMAAVEDIAAALDEETRAVLAEPRFPFGRGDHPVFWSQDGVPHIRYYRDQVDRARQSEDRLSPRRLAALAALDEVLRRDEIAARFRIADGETIFIHNTKALHGRTGFRADSDRLMLRFRIHAGCLG